MASSLPILTFHAIDERRSAISFPPWAFRHAIARLHEAGYRTVSLTQVAERVGLGAAFPERSVAITFDDGYRSVYEVALPTLRERGMSATVFPIVGEANPPGAGGRPKPYLDREMLSWAEMREMQREGMHFGAHTLTHPDLTRLPADRAAAEIVDSKALIEDALGEPVACFAYPFGCHDPATRAVVREHFTCGCSTELGLVAANSDPYALERVDACYLRGERLFGLAMSGALPWYLAALRLARRLRRVVGGRGSC